MRVIPVIDLKNGQVVRARFGERSAYGPIDTPLAAGSDPSAVAAGLLALHPFDALYIADIDAIEGRGRNDAVAAALAEQHPGVEIWVDSGLDAAAAVRAWCAAVPARPVLGSESGFGPGLLAALADSTADPILSLDHRGERTMGDRRLFAEPTCWPRDVIVMTLARVGSGIGPDFERLAAVLRQAGPERRVIAAGGVRGAEDLARLKGMGVCAALVASALHDGRLDGRALATLSG